MSAEQAAKDPACGQSVGVGIGSLFAFLSAIEPLKPRDIAVRSSLSPPLAHTRLALGGLGPKVVLMRVGHKQVTSNTRAGTVYSIWGMSSGMVQSAKNGIGHQPILEADRECYGRRSSGRDGRIAETGERQNDVKALRRETIDQRRPKGSDPILQVLTG